MDRVSSFTFLGVILDENLLWKDHTQFVRSKLAKNIG